MWRTRAPPCSAHGRSDPRRGTSEPSQALRRRGHNTHPHALQPLHAAASSPRLRCQLMPPRRHALSSRRTAARRLRPVPSCTERGKEEHPGRRRRLLGFARQHAKGRGRGEGPGGGHSLNKVFVMLNHLSNVYSRVFIARISFKDVFPITSKYFTLELFIILELSLNLSTMVIHVASI